MEEPILRYEKIDFLGEGQVIITYSLITDLATYLISL